MYNAAVWLSKVEESTGETIKVDWQPFSLAQVNSDNNDGNIKLWDQPEVKDGTDKTFMEEAAVAAGLDMARFSEDQSDPDLLKDIGESHTKAVEEYGAFGVPTFIFGDGKATFLKMFIPPDEQAAEIYETLTKVMSQFEHVGEIKRPQPPWPHGVI